MHTGQRDMIRVRISKADFEAGFKFKHIGEVLYAKIKSEFDTVVDKCQVKHRRRRRGRTQSSASTRTRSSTSATSA